MTAFRYDFCEVHPPSPLFTESGVSVSVHVSGIVHIAMCFVLKHTLFRYVIMWRHSTPLSSHFVLHGKSAAISSWHGYRQYQDLDYCFLRKLTIWHVTCEYKNGDVDFAWEQIVSPPKGTCFSGDAQSKRKHMWPLHLVLYSTLSDTLLCGIYDWGTCICQASRGSTFRVCPVYADHAHVCRLKNAWFMPNDQSPAPRNRTARDKNAEKLSYIWGPMDLPSPYGMRYFLFVVDHYDNFRWVRCIRSKGKTYFQLEKIMLNAENVRIRVYYIWAVLLPM
jgi:hypothetical protein